MNSCNFVGRLARDVELRYSTSGTPIASFTLAVERKVKTEGQPDTDFFQFVAFGKLAEVMAQYLIKGRRVAVQSRAQSRTWTDKDNRKHYITEFVVESFTFCDSANKNKQDIVAEATNSVEEEEFIL